jgi:hypothetical protein
MPKLNNEPYLGLIAEIEAEMPRPLPESVINAVRSEMLRNYRSLPSNHPFYSEGAQIESAMAGWASDIWAATLENREAGFFPETSDAPPEQPTKTTNF